MSDKKIQFGEIPPPHHFVNVERLKAVTKGYWDRFPEFLAVCVDLSHLERVPFWQSVKTIGAIRQFVMKAKKPHNTLRPCPILLFHSSYKPAYWPAISLLADRLVRKGLRCALISNDRMEIRCLTSSDTISIENVMNYRYWRDEAFSISLAVKTVLRGLWAALVLFWLSFRLDYRVLENLIKDPVKVWFHLTMSAHRFELSRFLLSALKPRLLLVNHERVHIGAELVMSPLAAKTFKIQICNEPPHHVILPFLSDEVWVWNDLAACLAEEASVDGSAPKITVIGSNEVDIALQPSNATSEAEIALRQQVFGKPILLFLSEYFPGEFYDHHERPLSQKVLAWLEFVARRCPEWHFILKPRQHEQGQRPPGTEFLDGLPNFWISDLEIPYRQYLKWDNLRAVAAVSSSGLFAAAGVGKTAIRLAVTQNRYCWPVVEEVSEIVNSPEEFVQVLKRLEMDSLAKSLHLEDDNRFPYRGRTVERMEQLCLKRLGDNPRKK